MSANVLKTLDEQIELTRSEIASSIETEITNLKEAIEERDRWLNGDRSKNPEFKMMYSKRRASLMKSVDARKDSVLSRGEEAYTNKTLSSKAVKLIELTRAKYIVDIQTAIDEIEDSYKIALETNPKFIGLSKDDQEHYDNHMYEQIEKTRKRMVHEMERSINAIKDANTVPRNRVKKKTGNSTDQAMIAVNNKMINIRKDFAAKYLEYKAEVESEELREIEAFDKYLLTLKNVPEHRVSVVKADNTARIKKHAEAKLKQYNIQSSRTLRMILAEEMEKSNVVPRDRISSMMDVYAKKINAVNIPDDSSVDWDKAMLDIDSTFDNSKGDWDTFTNVLRDYWGYIAMPHKRKEYDRLARLYCVVFKPVEPEEKELSIADLRSERNALLSQVLTLDATIKTHTYVPPTKTAKPVTRTKRAQKTAIIYETLINASVDNTRSVNPDQGSKRHTKNRSLDINW